MVHDSVREELQTKVGNGTHRKIETPVKAVAPQPIQEPDAIEPARAARTARTITTELNRAKTSPTLVEFQTKNPAVPDWRLQLQNAVRYRKANVPSDAEGGEKAYQTQLVTNGANALKADYVEEKDADSEREYKDQRVANALKRIDNSRKTFLPELRPETARTPIQRNYPFNVVSRTAEPPVVHPPETDAAETKASVNLPPKPRLVPTVTLKKTGYDTNKLPAIEREKPISCLDMPVAFTIEPPPHESAEAKIAVEAVPDKELFIEQPTESEAGLESGPEEIDDLAPFAARFNAGLFDLIIGLFASLILLSPVAFAGGNWFSAPGFLALAGVCSIVMFVYLTVSLALLGRTAGMKLFSLELVDADLNEYPSFHQAAVSSAVYLLTLPLCGVGFLTVFFNDEGRAAHDMLSGTIVISEF